MSINNHKTYRCSTKCTQNGVFCHVMTSFFVTKMSVIGINQLQCVTVG